MIAILPAQGYTFLSLIVIASIIFLILRYARATPPTPEELEDLRRNRLTENGKLGGGEVADVQGFIVSYMYDVRGVNYFSTQDLSALTDRLPGEPWTIIGGVGVRYDPRNPANSIILSASWSGLRKA